MQETHTAIPFIERRIGAYVWNDRDALQLCRAGLPVYYIRPYSDFGSQRIIGVTPITPSDVCITPAEPPYPVIYTGQAGSDDKFAAIRIAGMQCYQTPSPFQNMHLPDQYTSSYNIESTARITSRVESSFPSSDTDGSSSGPVRSTRAQNTLHPYERPRGKPQRSNPPQMQRDLFADFPHDNDLTPPPLTAWREANKSIDVQHPNRHHTSGQPPKCLTVAPDPAMFFGSDDRERQLQMLTQWHHVKGAILQCIADGSMNVLQPNATWKKILLLKMIGLPENRTVDPDSGRTQTKAQAKHSKSQQDGHRQAVELIQAAFSRLNLNKPLTFPDGAVISLQDAKSLVFEVCMVNFRHQLTSLDEKADTTGPAPSQTTTTADVRIAAHQHRYERQRLIDTVLGGPVDSASAWSQGLAAKYWPDRLKPLRAFANIMDSWPGEKGPLWGRGNDPNLSAMQAAGEQWEQALVVFYVQSYYNYFGHPPILPRRL
ncbi:hypothetical protein VNI00_016018 [Paramarasmius palmivorus]|uniref:Uncharacterized protein n=1 Tax=Paramarasmius palmivorus TaxID=297713 RepID=A0AAW0BG97_9AGAR